MPEPITVKSRETELERISVSPDRSEPGKIKWIVSRDLVDQHGPAISAQTLGVYDDLDDALASAHALGQELRLYVVGDDWCQCRRRTYIWRKRVPWRPKRCPDCKQTRWDVPARKKKKVGE